MGSSITKSKCKYKDCSKKVHRNNLCICHQCLYKEKKQCENPVKINKQFCSNHITECQYTNCKTNITNGVLCTLHQCIHVGEDDARCPNPVLTDRQFCEAHSESTAWMRLVSRLYFFYSTIRPMLI